MSKLKHKTSQNMSVNRQDMALSQDTTKVSGYSTSVDKVDRGPQWPSGKQVWHLSKGCYLCVGSTPTSDNAEDLSQYDPGC